ncbi:YjbQ family protein [bacterium]|nr:YjbQ family protein [bacterium]
MEIANQIVTVHTKRQGLIEITPQILEIVRSSQVKDGLCTVFIRHTSASLIIQENADPSARTDLEYFLNKLIPENDTGFTHTAEGSDDMPSHIKSAITQTALSIPVVSGELALGTWQGIYLWEHRVNPHLRKLVVNLVGR